MAGAPTPDLPTFGPDPVRPPPPPDETAVAKVKSPPERMTRRADVLAQIAVACGILAVGMGLRAWFIADPNLAHDQDVDLFLRWSRGLAEKGLASFYAAERFCDYPPLSILIFQAIGKFAVWIGSGSASDALLQVVFKSHTCIADLIILFLIWVEARRLFGGWPALAAAGLYFLNPISLYDGAIWGQVDAVYTSLIVLAFVFVARRNWHLAGAAGAAALLIKFQTIAVLPLLIFEAFRLARWRGLLAILVGGLISGVIVLAPFAFTETLDDVLSRSYVRVVGQYQYLAKGAFNIWQFGGNPEASDTAVPAPIVRIVSQQRDTIAAHESLLLLLSWRNISLVIYALAVAIVLTIYAGRPGPVARWGAAGLLALAFYLFPTEMHERYAFPAVALLAIWAVAAPWNERVYVAFSALLLLNIAAILPPSTLAAQIGAANLLVFAVLLGFVAFIPSGLMRTAGHGLHAMPDDPTPPPSRLIAWFRRLTVIAILALALSAGAIAFAANRVPPLAQKQWITYLSSLTPKSFRQGWRTPQTDGAVSGGMLRLGDSIYLRGIGTHAPGRLVYTIPPNQLTFHAIAGIDGATSGAGSVLLHIELDGKRVWSSELLTGKSAPIEIEIPLNDAREISLIADATNDGNRSDHVDWALARFESGAP